MPKNSKYHFSLFWKYMHGCTISTRDSAHDFSVKFSPRVLVSIFQSLARKTTCVHVAVAALTREVTAICQHV